jgi:hypothetical protein
MVAALFYRHTQHIPTISGRRRGSGLGPFRLLALSQKGEAMFRGLLDHGRLYHKYDHSVRHGLGLGSNLWLDARSLDFMVENSPADMGRRLDDQEWERVLVVLYQGRLQSCTGNAGIGALGTQPLYDAVGRDVLPAPRNGRLAEKLAVQLYADSTRVDEFPGAFPPRDEGSSALAICKVLKRRGTIQGYRWARSAFGLLQLLQDGPVLQGMPWHVAFSEPDNCGFIDSRRFWSSSPLDGRHEVVAVGVELDQEDTMNSTITYVNSWGKGWGDEGRFRMRLRTYDQLNEVDLAQLMVDGRPGPMRRGGRRSSATAPPPWAAQGPVRPHGRGPGRRGGRAGRPSRRG